MFELGTFWRTAPKFDVAGIRDALTDRLYKDVLVQAFEGDGVALFKGRIKEVTPVLGGKGRLGFHHAALFWIYDNNGHLNGMHKTFGFSNQCCDLARVVSEDGTVIYEESTLVREWEDQYRVHRKKMNGSGDIHHYKTLLDNYGIKVG